ncbi:MAG: Histidinol-phosphate aminotransferase [Candidatus Gottesmanbacteria bacterium GW2011_GWC2_39_8]|uniref:Histidinol-phosphate aminotransferase n=1 Tax=Candidatus Gottesmanbacteria bacterium GW2011_GWC2_39_8 TaxID=1618450 RepID=A0A0G0T2E9_9BACT|nr:MAG: Histidinol-phosphate aminotransferase [Candidatus Gottesmanbacteria bacterium GW2011_GWC2_39_8]
MRDSLIRKANLMIIDKTYAEKLNRAKVDMGLSENPLGCSPMVLKALRNISTKDLSVYPNQTLFKQSVAKKFRVILPNIVLGGGSEQLIKLICQTLLNKGDRVVIQRGSFALFTKESLLAGSKVIFNDPREMQKDLKVKLIFLCNPNNPTGEVITQDLIKIIVDKNKEAIIVIDEAIGEFIDESFVIKAVKSDNCIVLKTLSKTFGLAGLRVGFCIGSRNIIRKLEFAQQPFPVSNLSLIGASAALSDKNFIKRTKDFIAKERKFLIKEITLLNLKVSDSVTNNLFISCPGIIIERLTNSGVTVFPSSEFPGMKTSGFRITIKDRKTNKLFIKKLQKAAACLAK